MGLMVGKVKSDRSMAISLGVDPVRYDKGDIVFNGAIRKEDRRCYTVFSITIKRMFDNGSISRPAYDMAEEICDTVNGITGSQFASMLDVDIIASAAGKSANKMPVGYSDQVLGMATKLRNWKALAGECWPCLLGVCVFGMTIEESAKFVRKRKGFVSASIVHTLEILASKKTGA